MAFCSFCGTQIPDGVAVCPKCGATVHQSKIPVAYVDPHDHTAEFDVTDISCNKVMAMAAYLIGITGMIIALLAAGSSPYVQFHVRQAMKLTIVNVLLLLLMAVLCWTVVVPLAGGVCMLVTTVLRVIAFFGVCGGKAKEIPIISSLGFLK